ncbi:MAG: hypothetical protein IIX84_01620 [Oscillospiraceae bacterium]|nr:hypothetical protein [Oscillospiraceae bacterium]
MNWKKHRNFFFRSCGAFLTEKDPKFGLGLVLQMKEGVVEPEAVICYNL